MPATERRGAGRRALLGLAAALAALAGLELALRALGRYAPEPVWYPGELPDRPGENFVRDAETGWRMRPDHCFARPAQGVEIEYRSDSEGFRTDPGLAPPRGEGLVALVGDSQAWGFGVPYPECFAARLQEELGLRVLNLSQPGFGVDQIGLALARQALPRRPALGVVAIFRDDFNRSLQGYRQVEGMSKPTFALRAGELVPLSAADRPAAPLRFLRRRTHLWGLAADLARRLGLAAPDRTWEELNFALLDRMVADAAAAGVPLVFLRVPRDVGTRFEALDRWAQSRGAPYLDPGLAPPEDATDLYLPDKHLSSAGHRWVAQRLAAFVRERHPELGR